MIDLESPTLPTPPSDALFRELPGAIGCPQLFTEGARPYAGGDVIKASKRFHDLVKRAARVAEAAGHEFTSFRFHDLRHRHAVDYLRAGGNIYDLQQRLGHLSVKNHRGVHLTAEEKRHAKLGRGSVQKREGEGG